MTLISANGTDLHHEVRGDGAPLLFVSGAGGDAGYWTSAAERLADTFTVVTYDRRGNSRSPSQVGHVTSLAEQADDAAALLRALDLAPAIVVGNSLGALITCELVARHPAVVDRAVLHEPPLPAVVPDGARIGRQLEALIVDGMAEGGPRRAMALFIGTVWTDEAYDRADPDTVERILANAEVFFGGELALVAGYRPEPERLRACGVPLTIAAGHDNRGTYLHTGTRWLADQLGVGLHEMSGAHVPYLDRPDEFADELRALLPDVVLTTEGAVMTDLIAGLKDVKARTAEALLAAESDAGASPVLLAVVREFDEKADKSCAGDPGSARDAVIELEQAGDSAKAAADADPGLGAAARQAAHEAHLAICILKTTV